jgi:hypothetical protein
LFKKTFLPTIRNGKGGNSASKSDSKTPDQLGKKLSFTQKLANVHEPRFVEQSIMGNRAFFGF